METSWSKPTRYLVLIMILAFGLWFVIFARQLVESLTIAALIAFFLNPLVTQVNRQIRLSRFWTVLLVYLISLAGIVTLVIIFAPVIPEQAANLSIQLDRITEEIQTDYFSGPIEIIGFTLDLSSFEFEIPSLDPQELARPDIILSALQTTSTNIGWFAVILITSFYLLKDWDALRDWLFKLAPPGYNDDMMRLYVEVQQVWNGYFRGQFRLSVIVGILTWIGLTAIGLPGAVIFGIAAGILDVILSVGPLLVAAVAGAVALFTGSIFFTTMTAPVFALLVLGIFGIIQALENIWLRPRIMSHSVHIHPAIIFIAIIASLALAGVLTALFIIPLLASIGVIGRYLYSRIFDIDPWAELAASSGVTEPEAVEEAVASTAIQE